MHGKYVVSFNDCANMIGIDQTRSTVTSASGLKTRNFGTIISELVSCISIHSECGSRLGGVSLEFTGEFNDEGFSVTECLGGSMELSEDQLELRYHVRGVFSSPSPFS